jgi:phosphohistidine swiveling domain-containing protein
MTDSATRRRVHRDPATGEPCPTATSSWRAGRGRRGGHPPPAAAGGDGRRVPDGARRAARHLDVLEQHERDLCDVEFTIESDTLWMLQTRVGKRSAAAAVRMAVEMVDEGLIDSRGGHAGAARAGRAAAAPAVRRRPEQVLATGLGASPGAAVGTVCLSTDEARGAAAPATPVILVPAETSPEDCRGDGGATGLLTARGGLVSHAAVVARGLGKPAVCGASALEIDASAGRSGSADVVVTCRRRDLDRRDDRRGRGRRVPLDRPSRRPPARTAPRLRRRAPSPARVRERRHGRRRATGARGGRRGHRAVPDRAPVPRRPTAAGAAGDPRGSEQEEADRRWPLEEAQRADFEVCSR